MHRIKTAVISIPAIPVNLVLLVIANFLLMTPIAVHLGMFIFAGYAWPAVWAYYLFRNPMLPSEYHLWFINWSQGALYDWNVPGWIQDNLSRVLSLLGFLTVALLAAATYGLIQYLLKRVLYENNGRESPKEYFKKMIPLNMLFMADLGYSAILMFANMDSGSTTNLETLLLLLLPLLLLLLCYAQDRLNRNQPAPTQS